MWHDNNWKENIGITLYFSPRQLFNYHNATCMGTSERDVKNITYPNPNPNQKNLMFRPQSLNPNAVDISARKELFTPASVSGLGILDSALCLTQYRIIKELERREARSCSNIFISIISMPHFSFYPSHFRL